MSGSTPTKHCSNTPANDVTEATRKVMAANKGRNTKPEIVVRKQLHKLGYRFRLHRSDLPGSPDIVFPSRRAVIHVHGCFWHQHPDCRLAKLPKTRPDFWRTKFDRNRRRDKAVEEALAALEWRTMVIWECEIVDLEKLVRRLRGFLENAEQL